MTEKSIALKIHHPLLSADEKQQWVNARFLLIGMIKSRLFLTDDAFDSIEMAVNLADHYVAGEKTRAVKMKHSSSTRAPQHHVPMDNKEIAYILMILMRALRAKLADNSAMFRMIICKLKWLKKQ